MQPTAGPCTASLFMTKPRSLQAKHEIAFCGDHKRWQILPNPRAALHHHQSPDVHDLVEGRSTAEKCAIIDAHMSSQQTVVCDDDVVSNQTIVSDVRARHQKIF